MTDIVTRITPPDGETLALDARAALQIAEGTRIDSPDMLNVVADELKTLKARAKALEEQRVAITKPLDEAKKAVMNLFRPALEYLGQAEYVYKGAIADYQRRIAEERRREQAAAEERARKERERLEALAAKQAAAGKEERAAETLARAEAAALAVAPPTMEAPKAAGISTRKKYSAEVVDKAELLRFVLATPMFMNLIVVDQSALNKIAAAQGEAFALPGCKLHVETIVAARAA